MVDVITTASNAVTGVVDLPSGSYPVAVAADNNFLFTANYDSSTVPQYDIPENYQPVGSFPVGAGPNGLAFVPAG
jgi:DNA-binding beta-propeller fold protein YncE